MLYGEKSRDELNDYAEKLLQNSKQIKTKRGRREIYDWTLDKFNLSTSVVDDMLTFKKDIKEFTPFEIFAVVWFLDRNSLSKFFTQDEIENLSNSKFDDLKATFPLVFDDMVQITPDQWIGKISLQQIMKLKRSRMLNYDENEQRALRRIKSGKEEIFKPYVNNRSVKEIKEAMENGTYIPDPITLNMQDGAEYNYSNHKLTIYSLPKGMFNLDDGYHRYLAMSQIADFNKDFDYPMELRIVAFSNSKATAFIFQQDQKTLMKRIVSETYDPNSVANKVVRKLNEEATSNINGMIGRNKAMIDSAVLSKLITSFYNTNKTPREEVNKAVISIYGQLKEKFNYITEQNDLFLGKYTDTLLFIVMYVFSTDLPKEKYVDTILSVYGGLTEEENKYFRIASIGAVRKKAINIIESKIAAKG